VTGLGLTRPFLGVFIGVDVHNCKTNTYMPLSHRRRGLGISTSIPRWQEEESGLVPVHQ
jgi:hypothetical protein